MKDTHTWAPGIVDKTGNMKQFVLKYGDNCSQFPQIYRYGIYKRAVIWAHNGDYRRAYQAIAENFNLREIKNEFKDKNINKSHAIFSEEKLALDEEKM